MFLFVGGGGRDSNSVIYLPFMYFPQTVGVNV